jgi:D-threo-aldose 1-dehydrogenase
LTRAEPPDSIPHVRDDPTRRIRLGTTSLEVTRLGLGTAPIGNLFTPVSNEAAAGAIRAAYDAGLRLFDTAPLYGSGLAEQRLGRALRARPRGEYTLATKVGRLLRAQAPPDPTQFFTEAPPLNPVFDFSYDGVMRSVEESLQRLDLDRIDILHIHDPDDHFEEALSGAYPALDELRAQKVIGALGAGMNQVEMLARFAREADFDCFLVAGRYSLLDQSAGRELLPLCAEKQIAVLVGGVFNSGLLAGGSTYDYVPASDERVAEARRISEICSRYGITTKAAAVQFPLRNPAVTAVLVGARTSREIEENIASLRTSVPDELWDELRSEGLLSEVPA